MDAVTPIPFDNSYARLPERFYSPQAPEPVSAPGLIRVNKPLAEKLGIDADWLASEAGVAVMAGNKLPTGAEPIATVYAGHQFGGWNPQLGDGRAVLLGEVIGSDGERYDIQLKGSGRTPYSRMGDGRAPLGPVLREYVISEAMYALGVPTTRALAAVTTGDPVYRQTALPGAVLARVARSHVRVGTFQFFAAQQDTEAIRLLADHIIDRHYPSARESANPTHALLQKVVAAQAHLIAQWQLLGFIHGVMNTDNMLLCGETVDYGPCAFMDTFNPDTVFSSIDHAGRYAYRNQPGIAHWNLACWAQTLLPLLHEDQEEAVNLAQSAIDGFPDLFMQAHTAGMGNKLGVTLTDSDDELIGEMQQLMLDHQCDFTLAFRRLADLADPDGAEPPVGELFEFPPAFDDWLAKWRARCEDDGFDAAERQRLMYRANPVFIPRNHRVEAALAAAEEDNDLSEFHRLVEIVGNPWHYDPELADYALPARPEEVVRQTFCGT